MRISFPVPGEPKGKGRHRSTIVGGYIKTYTPAETVAYENLIKLEFKGQCGGVKFPDDAQLDLRVKAYYQIPKSASRNKRAAMLSHQIRPTKKPDADNLIKVIADSLNGLAYRDDAQICDAMIRKFYSDQPRIEIVIQTTKEIETYEQTRLASVNAT